MVPDKPHLRPGEGDVSSGLGVLRKPGVLVISHGSADEHWVALVDEAVEAAKVYLPADLPVYSSYLELVPGRLIQDGINWLEAQGVTDMIVIPFFVSSGSTHIDEIAYALGVKAAPEKETEMKRLRVSARVFFGDPIDDDPLVAEMVWDKIKTLSFKAEREVLLLVGHGSRYTEFLRRWELGMTSLAERTGQLSGLAATDVAFLSPDTLGEKVRYWTEERGMEVLVAPLFLSTGYFTKRTIPGRLEGLRHRYAGESLLPHPLLARWMSQQILNIMKLFTL